MKSKKFNLIMLPALLCLIGTACIRSRDQREIAYMPDMYYSLSIKAQEADSAGLSLMRLPAAGTVPQGTLVPYPLAPADTLEAMAMLNPLPRTAEVLAVGQKYFNIYCIVCHGPRGAGDGYIVPKLPRPPDLSSVKVRTWTDGRIYHLITNGQGNMPSYKTSIDPTTRWAIIHYLRAIQRAENPTPEDLILLGDSAKK